MIPDLNTICFKFIRVSLIHSPFGEYSFRGNAISLVGDGPITEAIHVKLEETFVDNTLRVGIPVVITIIIFIIISGIIYWRYKKKQLRLDSFDRVVLMSDIHDPYLAECIIK